MPLPRGVGRLRRNDRKRNRKEICISPVAFEQRHLDLIGLFLVAAGVYLVFVLFLGWEGGKVGYGIETGLGYLFGKVGSRIFTLLILLVGGMLLTGTSVAALARGIGRAVATVFHSSSSSRTRTRPSAIPTPNGAATARSRTQRARPT